MNRAMSLTEQQANVLRGMGLGIFVSLLLVLYGIIFNPFSFSESEAMDDRILVLARCLLIPLSVLIVSIARIARYRFFLLKILIQRQPLHHRHHFYASNRFSRTLLSKRFWLHLSIMCGSWWLPPCGYRCFLSRRVASWSVGYYLSKDSEKVPCRERLVCFDVLPNCYLIRFNCHKSFAFSWLVLCRATLRQYELSDVTLDDHCSKK